MLAKLVVAGVAAALVLLSTDAPHQTAAGASAPVQWVHRVRRMTVGGQGRTYLVDRPATTSRTRLPVLVVLHGRTMTPTQMEETSGFLAVLGPSIVVYPAGYRDSWNAGACCGDAHTDGVDDVRFLTGLVHRVLTTEPDASPSAVYLAGYSNGGRMALRLACDAPGLFAAVAAVEAVPVYTCARPTPVSLLEIASSDDPLLAMGPAQPKKVVDGFPEPDVESVVAGWRQLDGCREQSSSSTTGTLTQTRWSGCRSGTKVEYALYHGGSHAWPEGAAATDTPSAQGVISSFFTGPRGGAG